jgi:hypothetical protein
MMPRIARRGLLKVLSSPSQAGKTTLARRLLAPTPACACRCRDDAQAAAREVDGRDYHFIDTAEFDGSRCRQAARRGRVRNCYRRPKARAGRAGRRRRRSSISIGLGPASSRSGWVGTSWRIHPAARRQVAGAQLCGRANQDPRRWWRRIAAAADDRPLGRVRLRHRQCRPETSPPGSPLSRRRAPEARAPNGSRRLVRGVLEGL